MSAAAAAARDTLPAQGESKEGTALTVLVGTRRTVLSTTVAGVVARQGMTTSRVGTIRGQAEVTGLRLAGEQEPALLMVAGLTPAGPQRTATVTLAVGVGIGEGTVAVRPGAWPRPTISILEQTTGGRVVSLRAPPATAIGPVTVPGTRGGAATWERWRIAGAAVMVSRLTPPAIGQMLAPAPGMIRATTAPGAPALAPAVAMDTPR